MQLEQLLASQKGQSEKAGQYVPSKMNKAQFYAEKYNSATGEGVFLLAASEDDYSEIHIQGCVLHMNCWASMCEALYFLVH